MECSGPFLLPCSLGLDLNHLRLPIQLFSRVPCLLNIVGFDRRPWVPAQDCKAGLRELKVSKVLKTKQFLESYLSTLYAVLLQTKKLECKNTSSMQIIPS